MKGLGTMHRQSNDESDERMREIDEEFYLRVEFPLALRISSILCNPEHHGKQLDAIMESFEPYLKQLYIHVRRSRIRRVK